MQFYQNKAVERLKDEVEAIETAQIKKGCKTGFKCALHKHHDHSSRKRFHETIICGSCNLIDARLKKALKIDDDFSFSPSEMKAVLKYVEPNTGIDKNQIDFDRAKKIYQSIIR